MQDLKEELRRIAITDGRFSPEAFYFLLFESIDSALKVAGKTELEGAARHVTGQELLAGMRAHAVEQFGPLAAYVWRSWGIHETLDWGRIVFLLVDKGKLKRQDTDSIEDFRTGFDFDTGFAEDYRARLDQLFASGGKRGEA